MPGLTSGASALADAAQTLADGSITLDDGAHTLSSGMTELMSGSHTLADGLSDAGDKIPTYTQDEASASATALASPIGVSAAARATSTATVWAPTGIVLALWLSAMVGTLAFGALHSRRVDSAATPAALAWSTLWPNLIVSAVAAILLAMALLLAGVSMSGLWGSLALMVACAAALTAVHQALIAVFGQRMGVLVSVVLLVGQAVTLAGILPAAAQSGFFASIRSALPLPVVEDALRTLMVGSGSGSVGAAVGVLLVWALAAVIASIAAVAKRRQTTLSQLRARALA